MAKRAAKRRAPPKPAPGASDVERARKLFRAFRSEEPGALTTVKLRVPRAGFVVGALKGLIYETSQDGRRETYQHLFRKSSAPLLVSDADGDLLWILGGNFRFTARGIVDR